jgi:hypothetical protein
VGADLAAVVRRHVTNDRQSQPGSARLARAGPIDAVETLEYAIEIPCRYSHPVIDDMQFDVAVVDRTDDLDPTAPF